VPLKVPTLGSARLMITPCEENGLPRYAFIKGAAIRQEAYLRIGECLEGRIRVVCVPHVTCVTHLCPPVPQPVERVGSKAHGKAKQPSQEGCTPRRLRASK